MGTDPTGPPDLDPDARAIHEVELALEWLHRAHGHLVAFHHAIGHAMDHLAEAEDRLRECGFDALADLIRDDHLPSGVFDEDTWTYDVLERFQTGFLADVVAFEARARETVLDGERHVAEREMQRTWRDRAERE